MISPINIDGNVYSVDINIPRYGYISQLNNGALISRFDELAEDRQYKYLYNHWPDLVRTIYELQKLIYKHMYFDPNRYLSPQVVIDLGKDYFNQLKKEWGVWTMHQCPEGSRCQNLFHISIVTSTGDINDVYCCHFEHLDCTVCKEQEGIYICQTCAGPVCNQCITPLSLDPEDFEDILNGTVVSFRDPGNMTCVKCFENIMQGRQEVIVDSSWVNLSSYLGRTL